MQSVSCLYSPDGESEILFHKKDSFTGIIPCIGLNEYDQICPSEQYREVTFWLGVEGDESA